MRNAIRLVVTDWSGVVSDDRAPVYHANNEMLRSRGHPGMTFEEWLCNLQPSAPQFMHALGFLEDLDALQQEYMQRFSELAQQHPPTPYPDAAQFFAYLRARGYPLVVLSTHPTENLVQEAQRYGVHEHFVSFGGDQKNKAQGLQELTQSFRVFPDQILFIGDMTFDIIHGKRAGVRTAAVCTGYHSQELLASEEPDILTTSLTELRCEVFDA